MAVDRPEGVPGGLGHLLRLPHPAAHLDSPRRPTKLKSGNAAEGVKLFNEFGHFDNIGWTQAMRTAFEDVFANCVRKNMDPEKALDRCDTAVNRELKKLFG